MFNQAAFGEKLKSHRKLKNLTQEEVAEKIGVSGQAVSKLEKGECLPDCYNLKMLGKIYQTSVDSLLDVEEITSSDALTGIFNKRHFLMKKANKESEWFENQSRFPRKLQELIEGKKITITDLAKAIGVSRQLISGYILGQSMPNLYRIKQIAEYFNISVGYLLDDVFESEGVNDYYTFIKSCEKWGGETLRETIEEIQCLAHTGAYLVLKFTKMMKDIPEYKLCDDPIKFKEEELKNPPLI